jgi:phage repressor protein C with HTH and peptisase S24 domain
MKTGEELKNAIALSGLTQAEIAEKIGLSRVHLNRLANSKKIPEHIFESVTNAAKSNISETSKDLKHFIPYYANVNASAGLNFLTKNATADVELISVPNLDVQAFINVFGDSMYPKYCSGEIIGIKEVEKEYLMFGHAYVVQMKDGEVYLKYIKKGRDDKHWSLASENAKYEPKDFHLDRIDKVFIIKAIITKTTM